MTVHLTGLPQNSLFEPAFVQNSVSLRNLSFFIRCGFLEYYSQGIRVHDTTIAPYMVSRQANVNSELNQFR